MVIVRGGRVLVTGSAGFLGKGLIRALQAGGHDVVGVDIRGSRYTTAVGSIADRALVRRWLDGVYTVLHTAALHNPHMDAHAKQEFVDTNITGTLALLEEAAAAGVESFVFTSSTSALGRALLPAPGQPTAWITEDVVPLPYDVYGITKATAEKLSVLIHQEQGLPVVVLRTSRFFLGADNRGLCHDQNIKANEYLYRRVDIQDVVDAHLLAMARAPRIGFGTYIISATTPFTPSDMASLRIDARAVVSRLFPDQEEEYARRGWRMFPQIDRVYVNSRARADLGWTPRFDFRHVLDLLKADKDPRSPLARAIGLTILFMLSARPAQG